MSGALPVDVVVPHLPSRQWFFRKYTLPSLEAQNPSRIIIKDGPGGACGKRNEGALEATSPYVFLCDDDLVVSGGYLERCLGMLEAHSLPVAYAYSDWIQVPMPGCMSPPLTHAQYVEVPEFEHFPLHDRGGVDFPIFRRECFQPFDEKVKRFQTWDWMLSMKKAGFTGKKMVGYNVISFMLDRGITTGTSTEDSAWARTYIQRKHGFIP